jgi:hypothetical protein
MFIIERQLRTMFGALPVVRRGWYWTVNDDRHCVDIAVVEKNKYQNIDEHRQK